MTIALDGSAAPNYGPSVSSIAATLTTAQTNDIIIVTVVTNDYSAYRTVSSVSGGGLTWARRGTSVQWTDATYKNNHEVWWAVAASPLSSVAITATLSASATYATIFAFGVSGADTTTPWDTNGALPASATHLTPTSLPTVNVSTSASKTMILGFESDTDAANCSAGSGYTAIHDADGSNGFAIEYKVVSATQSALAVNVTTSVTNWAIIGDALRELNTDVVTSTVGQLLLAPTQSMTNTEIIPTTIGQLLLAPTQSMTNTEIIPTTIDQLLLALTQSMTNTEIIPTTIGQTLASLSSSETGFVSGDVEVAVGSDDGWYWIW